jgi:hypothetical protein
MNSSWGYGREGVGNDMDTFASEKTTINFEVMLILVN